MLTTGGLLEMSSWAKGLSGVSIDGVATPPDLERRLVVGDTSGVSVEEKAGMGLIRRVVKEIEYQLSEDARKRSSMLPGNQELGQK